MHPNPHLPQPCVQIDTIYHKRNTASSESHNSQSVEFIILYTGVRISDVRQG